MSDKKPIAIFISQKDFVEFLRSPESIQVNEVEGSVPVHPLRDLETSVIVYADGTTKPLR